MRRSFLLALAVFAATAPAEDLWRVARDHEDAFRRALLSKDLRWLERVAAPGFYGEETDGTRSSRGKMITALRDYLNRRNIVTVEPTILSVVRRGTGMVVRVRTRFVAQIGSLWNIAKLNREAITLHEECWSKGKTGWSLTWIRQLEDAP